MNQTKKQKTNEISQEAILPPDKELTPQEKHDIVVKADDAHVLMKYLVKTLDLDLKDLTQNQIIHAFSQLQLRAAEYRKEFIKIVTKTKHDENQAI